MIALAAVAGYLVGSVPTAGLLGRLWGVDLRTEGSGNPGTRNAIVTGGKLLGVTVLLVEAVKGYAAVELGGYLADDQGVIAAGIGAVAGNVFNVWYRFQGGKGLGISLGILAGAWPTVLPFVLGVIVLAVVMTRSAGLASLATMAALIVLAVMWGINDWATGGVEPDDSLLILAVGMTLIMGWKHWRDSPLNPAWNSERRTRV